MGSEEPHRGCQASRVGFLRRVGPALVLASAALLLVWAYSPAFDAPPKRDQLHYLLEISRAGSFGEILGKSLSFNRTRTVEAGDVLLFRPGLFLLLAVEAFLFDYHFEVTRWISLGIHLFVGWLLYRLLRRIAGLSPPAPAEGSSWALPLLISAFFLFSPMLVEVVSWEHIQGYLVFSGLILFALDHGARLESGEGHSPGRSIAWIWLALFVAIFFHESALIFVAAFGLYCAAVRPENRGWSRRRRAGIVLAFGAIAAIYLAVSFWDYRWHSSAVDDRLRVELLEKSSLFGGLSNALRFVIFCGIQPLVPMLVSTEAGNSVVAVRDVFVPWDKDPDLQILLFAVLLSVLTAACLGVAWMLKVQWRVRRWYVFLLLSLLGSHGALYVVLRMNPRAAGAVNFLGFNSQYLYFTVPLCLALLYLGLVLLCAASSARAARRWRALAMTYFGGATLLSIPAVYLTNQAGQVYSRDVREKILGPGRRALDELKSRGIDRVRFVYEDSALPVLMNRYGAPLSTIYFGRHEDFDHPEAVVLLPSGKILAADPLPKSADEFPFYQETIPHPPILYSVDGRPKVFNSSYAVYRTTSGWHAHLVFLPYVTVSSAVNLPFAVDTRTRAELLSQVETASAKAASAALRGGSFLASGPPVVEDRTEGFLLVSAFGNRYAIPASAWPTERPEDFTVALYGDALFARDLETLRRSLPTLRGTPP